MTSGRRFSVHWLRDMAVRASGRGEPPQKLARSSVLICDFGTATAFFGARCHKAGNAHAFHTGRGVRTLRLDFSTVNLIH